ncbi:MAG: ATP-dependent RNA helicase HrpA [Planctomycetota bacterium]
MEVTPSPDLARVENAMFADQPGLRSLARRIRQAQRDGKPYDRNLKRFDDWLSRSIDQREKRASTRPSITYRDDLPISKKRDDIAALIRDHQVVVVCGETGSGKSTQLPKILMDLGYGTAGMIAHTQPRRIAARTLACRVSEELGVPLGQQVGFAVRFNDTSGPLTQIRYLTDGLLLAELARDPDLLAYDAIIVDEAHERSLNIDFLLGYLKRLLERRPQLKLIITSATIDTQRFAEHFGSTNESRFDPAPIIEVTGRTYPVNVRYRPISDDESETVLEGPALDHALCGAVDEVTSATDGDVLIFMPTERAIAQTAKVLRGYAQSSPSLSRGKPLEILPLYARLSNAEQQKVFHPKGATRRVVIATNVAESSVTVPGITAVIDPGTARISRYSPRSRMQRLPIEPVSQASANQRAGRCGRIAPGVCIRLCSEEQFEQREAFTTPEIQRTNLAAVILRMASLKLGDVSAFPFLDPPKPAAIREGVQTLRELGAVTDAGELTKTGGQLAKLPIDPRVGRMVLAGSEQGCLAEVLVIASALEGQDPRVRPQEHAAAADQCHAAFSHPDSDFLTLFQLWDYLHEQKAALSNSKFRKLCQKQYLSYPRVREWMDLHRQLLDLAREANLKLASRVGGEDGIAKAADSVHRALLAGLLSNVAIKTNEREYTGAHGIKLRVWPGSSLAKARPRWIVSAEVVATSQQFARTCARINPEWIEPIARDLVTTTHSQPHWVKRGGFVAAYEKVTLYGLVLIPKRRIRYAKINPAQAREIFIHEALVEEDTDLRAPFLKHNRELRQRIETMQAKQRRYDLLADAQARFAFYDRRLPTEVVGVAELNRYLKRIDRQEADRFCMTEQDLLTDTIEPDDGRPDHMNVGGMKLPLKYKFATGSEDDGVTLEVPLHALGRLTPFIVDWGVPGTLTDRITGLIRSLPKEIRKPLVPAPDSAKKAAARMEFGQGDFLASVADALGHVAGEVIDPKLFDPGKVEEHQRMNVAIVDAQGERIAQGRNVAQLQRDLHAESSEAVADLTDPDWHRDGLTAWPELVDMTTLPDQVETDQHGFKLLAYPALIDQGDSAGLRLAETPERAAAWHFQGVMRLCFLNSKHMVETQWRNWRRRDDLVLLFSTLGNEANFLSQLVPGVSDRVYAQPAADYPPRSAEAFDALLLAGQSELKASVHQICDAALSVLQTAQSLRLELDRLRTNCPSTWDPALRQSTEQLDELAKAEFLSSTPAEWLPHLSRFLEASRIRLRKLREGKVDRDRQAAQALEERMHSAQQLRGSGEPNPEWITYRWMLEEWRVLLFAQELGTSIPVSEKRLDRQKKKVERMN